MITLTIPNDDTIALRQFGKALIEIASAKEGHPVDVTVTPLVISTDVNAVESGINPEITDAYMQGCRDTEERLNAATGKLMQAAPHMLDELRIDGAAEIHGKRKEPEIDTTAQQVESLATNVVHREVHFDNPAPQVSDAATDSTGTPWDERIHSASKALNADGTWRLRRKPKDMDEAEWAALVESVKNELMGVDEQDLKEFEESKQATLEPPVTLEDAVNASIEAVHTGIAREFGTDIANAAFTGDRNEPPVTPPGDDFHSDAGVVTEQTVAGIPPIPVPPPVVSDWTFPKLMTFLTERQGKIDVATVNMLLAQDGIASLPELNAHPDKIGPFVARVKAHLGE